MFQEEQTLFKRYVNSKIKDKMFRKVWFFFYLPVDLTSFFELRFFVDDLRWLNGLRDFCARNCDTKGFVVDSDFFL